MHQRSWITLLHRFGRSWTVGVSAGATRTLGIGTPDLRFTDTSFTLARLWYPSW